MNVLRLHVERRPGADLGPVEHFAVRRGPQPGLLAGRREVVAAEDFEESRISRVDLVTDHVADALAILLRGDLCHRRNDRLRDRDREQPIELLDRPLGDDPRGGEAGGKALAQDVGVGGHVGRVGPQPRDEFLQALRRVGRLELADLRQERLRSTDLVDDSQAMSPLIVLLDAEIGDDDQHVAGDPILDRQAGRRDRLGLRLRCLHQPPGLRSAGRARILETIGVALVAVDGRGRRIELQDPLPEPVGQGVDRRDGVVGQGH